MKRELAIVLAGGILTVGMQLEVLARGGGGGGGGGARGGGGGGGGGGGAARSGGGFSPSASGSRPAAAAKPAQVAHRVDRRGHAPAAPHRVKRQAPAVARRRKARALDSVRRRAQPRRNPRRETVPRRVRSEISWKCLAARWRSRSGSGGTGRRRRGRFPAGRRGTTRGGGSRQRPRPGRCRSAGHCRRQSGPESPRTN